MKILLSRESIEVLQNILIACPYTDITSLEKRLQLVSSFEAHNKVTSIDRETVQGQISMVQSNLQRLNPNNKDELKKIDELNREISKLSSEFKGTYLPSKVEVEIEYTLDEFRKVLHDTLVIITNGQYPQIHNMILNVYNQRIILEALTTDEEK